MNKLKELWANKKFRNAVFAVVAVVAGYFGVEEASNYTVVAKSPEGTVAAPEVIVEFTAPEHVDHKHKNWTPVIDRKIKKGKDANKEI